MRRRKQSGLAVIVLIASVPLAIAQSTPVSVFEELAVEMETPSVPGLQRMRLVRMRLPAAAPSRASGTSAPKLFLHLFDDLAVTVTIDEIQETGLGLRSWVGRADGHANSTVVLVEKDGFVSGNIVLAGKTYRVQPLGPVVHMVAEVDARDYPEEDPPIPVPDTSGSYDFGGSGSTGDPSASADDGTRFDLLVLYTPAARDAAGGVSGIETLVQLGVTETNLAYQNSDMAPRLRLVHMREVSYTEAGSMSTDLSRITNPSDGFMDLAHSLRDTYGADLVKLVVQAGGSCGVAWLMCGNNPGFESSAFSVTAQSCISPNYTFAHELGHNMGSNHAPVDPTGCGAFSHSFGYKDLTNDFRTVMAYAPGARTLHFSNPDIDYLGFPTGTSTQDNARSIDDVRNTIAGFRSAVGTPAITTPTPSSTLGSTAVTFEWSANGASVDEWTLFVGSSTGASDHHSSGSLGTSLSTTVGGLPDDGTTVYVRLNYLIAGFWEFSDFEFQAFGGGLVVTGDWNDDGIDAPWTFYNGSWQVPASDGGAAFAFGTSGDLPIVGDWDGDGDDDAGVYRPGDSPSTFYLDIDRDGAADWTIPLSGSFPQDVPVAGDWDNDGDDDVATWSPAAGRFYLFEITGATSLIEVQNIALGRPTDTPVAGNWNGTTGDEVGVFRPNEPAGSNNFYFRRGNGTVEALTTMPGGLPGGWGALGDVPFTGDWDGSGYDTIALYRPSTAEYFYDTTRPRLSDGVAPPTVTTDPVSGLGEIAVTLHQTVNPRGGATSAWFEYGLAQSYGQTTTVSSAGAGINPTSVATPLSGLSCNTLYYFRAVASNSDGTAYGTDSSFTTLPCSVRAPDVTTDPLLQTFPDRAQLAGTVVPNGSPTIAFFEYGETTSYGSSTLSVDAGDDWSSSSFSAWLDGLDCSETYHYRAVAVNAVGTRRGSDRTFTTGCMPELTAPASGSTLSGATQLFEWVPNAETVTLWWIYAGSTPGGTDYFNAGFGGGESSGSVTGLPTDGSTVYIRFWYQLASSWEFTDYQYLAAGASPAPRNPTPLDGSTGASHLGALSWLGGHAGGTFNVYFGATPAPPLVSSGQSGSSYDPGALAFATTYHWRVGAVDVGGAETLGPQWSFTTVSECAERLSDGGFETGTPWSAVSSNFGTPVCGASCSPDRARSGNSWLWFGRTAVESAAVEQSVAITAGTAELTFYLWISDASGNASDAVRVLIDGVEVFSALENDAGYSGGYVPVTVDVSAFANGGTHTVRFESTTSGPAVTNFHVDDASLNACERTLTAPSPIGPSGTVSVGTPTFSWSPVADATSYRLVVDNAADGVTALDQSGIAATSFTPASPLATETTYHWRVLATDGVLSSPFSADTIFSIDTAGPDAVSDLTATVASSAPERVDAPARFSSGDVSTGKGKGKATDRDPATFWSTPGRGALRTEFITADMGVTRNVGRVRLLSRNRGKFFPVDLEIQVSHDNVSFTTVTSASSLPSTAGLWHTFDFSGTSARYVRVFVTRPRKVSGTYKVQLAELEVYELPPANGTLDLTWTATGDNGGVGTASSYDLRWSDAPITSENFEAATSIALAPPQPAGSIESVTVSGLPDETRIYFAMTVSDDVPLASLLSNVADAVTLGAPPPPVTDLVASSPGATTVELSWTAVTDVGPDPDAGSYDVRYATSPIDEASFDSATPVTGASALVPLAGGSSESFSATGLPAETTLYFAIKVIDKLGNRSPADTGAEPVATTLDGVAPAGITDLAAAPGSSTPVRLDGTAIASSGDVSSGKGKAKAVDRDPLTFWSTPSRGSAVDEFITVRLASVSSVGRVRLLSRDRGGYFPEDLEIQVSTDNVSFTPVAVATALPSTVSTWHTFDFTSITARYVRVYITKSRLVSGAYRAQVAEIEAYEVPLATGTVDLTWTAPGDNGTAGVASSYDLRWSTAPIDASSFGSATPVALPAPQPAGSAETATVSGLPDETRVYFAIVTSDELPLASPLSNVADAATAGAPPPAIDDLAASSPTSSTIELSWTAVADGGPDPRAGSYDLRYSTAPIHDANFAAATPVPGASAIVPMTAGGVETLTATGLPAETLHYFAIRVSDQLGNMSATDTGPDAFATTLDGDPPANVTDLTALPGSATPVRLSGTATASSGDLSSTKGKRQAADRDPGTFWSTPSRSVAQDEFITVDLGNIQNVGRVRLLSRSGGAIFPEDLEIQLSNDNVDFVTVLSVTGLPATVSTWHDLDFTSASAQYVRVYITKTRLSAGYYKTQIAEVEAWDVPVATGTVELGWTAPGDNGTAGTASSYDLRWSTSPIDAGNFGSATRIQLAAPRAAGGAESVTLNGLPSGTRVYFALTTSDEVPITSGLSNVADTVTP